MDERQGHMYARSRLRILNHTREHPVVTSTCRKLTRAGSALQVLVLIDKTLQPAAEQAVGGGDASAAGGAAGARGGGIAEKGVPACGAGLACAHCGDANAVSVCGDGHFVVSGGDDGRIKLWY